MSEQDSGLTYAEAIRIAAEKLRDAGLDDPRYEARLLVQWATKATGADLILRERDMLSFAEHAAWQHAVRHRLARRPLAHLEGYAWFYGLQFQTDPRALIPRADSECVVELALGYVPTDAPQTIADLGTGTGALLTAILANRPNAIGIAIERSADAAALARENLTELGFAARARVLNQSWTGWTGWADCDLIISNPPYIESFVIPTLQPEVRDHDPMDALDGGADGLVAYREIITLGAAQMKAGAHLVLEIGYDQKDSVSTLLHAAGFTGLTHRKDLGGNDRAIAARAPQ